MLKYNLPDKLKVKATITNTLRQQIAEKLLKIKNSKYLEIGSHMGYTMASLVDSYESAIGIEKEFEFYKKSKDLFGALNDPSLEKIKIILGTSNDLPQDEYHVILVDADHSYSGIRDDYENILKFNKAQEYYIFFHDYGLNGPTDGTKKFINETFKDFTLCGQQSNWNPGGYPINDWEAAMVKITNQ